MLKTSLHFSISDAQLSCSDIYEIASMLPNHTQGATVSHAGPYASLSVPVLPLDEIRPLYEFYVIPFYMCSLSQFGPQEETALKYIQASLTDQLITTLLSDFNWRSRTAATYFALILDRPQHVDHIGRLLLRSDVCYVGAAYCRYLAHVRSPEAVDFLNRYLAYYLAQPKLYFDQADAVAALRYIDLCSGSRHEHSHTSSVSLMVRERPDFLAHVSLEGLSSDIAASDRLRYMLQTKAEQDAGNRATPDAS